MRAEGGGGGCVAQYHPSWRHMATEGSMQYNHLTWLYSDTDMVMEGREAGGRSGLSNSSHAAYSMLKYSWMLPAP